MKYEVTLLYYTSRKVVVEADDSEEAEIRAQALPLNDEDCLELGKNAILEGTQGAIEK